MTESASKSLCQNETVMQLAKGKQNVVNKLHLHHSNVDSHTIFKTIPKGSEE